MAAFAYQPHQAAEDLGVSPATLRRWSLEFSDYLGPRCRGGAVGSDGRGLHRVYYNSDLAVLHRVKVAMAEGLGFAATRERLNSEPTEALSSTSSALVSASAIANEETLAAFVRGAVEAVAAAKDETIVELRGRLVERDERIAALTAERDTAVAGRPRHWWSRG